MVASLEFDDWCRPGVGTVDAGGLCGSRRRRTSISTSIKAQWLPVLMSTSRGNIERGRRAGRAYTMASSSSSPCAACKFLRRKCTSECVFAPYFPPDQPHKFANVHKIFGASNITKLLNELPVHQREDAVNSLAYEAEARVKDPVYGCVGAISVLQRQVAQLQTELSVAHSDLARYAGGGALMTGPGVTQGMPSSSLGIGINLSGGHSREQQMMRADHYNVVEIARDPTQLTRDHLTREHLVREQSLRDLARGQSPYDAAFSMGGSMGVFPPGRQGSDVQQQLGHFSRQGSDAGSGGSGMGGHLSPP